MTAARFGRAHPRSRGENHFEYARPETVKGSSPLTRGKLHRHVGDVDSVGLIPAHAGKTACSCAAWTSRRAHPRSRGENWETGARAPRDPGSSPLTRGKLGHAR